MNNLLRYSMSTLISIGNGARNSILNRLDPITWNKINNFGICSSKTQRGCRAGKNKQRNIKTVTDIFDRSGIKFERGVNHSNLSPIQINHNQGGNLIHIACNSVGSSYDIGLPRTKFASWNAWSINKKTTSLVDLVIDKDLDVLALQETWPTGTPRDDCTLADIKSSLPNFAIFNTPRGTRGGGEIASKTFLTEFSSLLECVLSLPEEVVITGDFNYHVDVVDDRDACAFKDLIDEAGLQQHVSGPTHRSGHTLDLMLSLKDSSLISDVGTEQSLPSDHYAVLCTLNFARPAAVKQRLRYRKIREIDIDEFRNDIASSEMYTHPGTNVNELANQYNSILRELLDAHTPVTERSVNVRPMCQWYSDSLRSAKRHKRRLERKFRKSKLEVDRQIYIDACRSYRYALNESKRIYHNDRITGSNCKQLFRIVDSLTNPNKDRVLPTSKSPAHLANEFADYFDSKIQKIRENLNSSCHTELSVTLVDDCFSCFSEFKEMTEDKVRELIMQSPVKSCSSDPIPTPLLKKWGLTTVFQSC
ncbi:uncharacterized protein [Amphiura filiformis]|uniref:uncharacterized protein n=1 Tax=Amphiura filiformis TaxID=82378 RepID=UPI003B220E58